MIYFYEDYYQENSYGISCVYEMVRVLNDSGIPARTVCLQDEEFCKKYYKPLPEKYTDIYLPLKRMPDCLSSEDTVVIPDVYEGEIPENAGIIRWLLNKPICLTGKAIDYRPGEYVVAYSKYINDKLPQLFMLKDERELLGKIRCEEKRQEGTVSVYFGKVHKNVVSANNQKLKTILNSYHNVYTITRGYPKSREETLRCLAGSELLISFDPLSNINYESCLLGTPTLMMDDSFGIKNKSFNIDNSGCFFDYSELQTAKQEVIHTFDYYCEWLEKQNQSIISFFVEAEQKISRIKNNHKELKENSLWNEIIKKQDLLYYQKYFDASPFTCINSVYDLPFETAKILGVKYYWINHLNRILRAAAVKILKKTGLLNTARRVLGIIKK